MSKKLLTIDYDGVLYDFCTPFIHIVKERTGKNIRLEDITTYSFAETLGLSEETINELITHIVYHHRIPVLPQAVPICQALSEDYQLVIVTSRNEAWRDQTQQPIEQ